MSTERAGTCPECEFSFTATGLRTGETVVCPECVLTLQVIGVSDERLELEVVETVLPDWGQ